MKDLAKRDSARQRDKRKWEDVTIEDVSDDDTAIILKKEHKVPKATQVSNTRQAKIPEQTKIPVRATVMGVVGVECSGL